MPHRYDVFLSHASADKPAVELLAHKLREAGIEPFLDKWHLIPGQPWQEALEEALDQSRTCAVFLGKTIGPWQNEEMRSALETRARDGRFRVIPVLLPGGKERGKEKLPRFLGRLTWVDLRTGLDDEDAFRRLLAGIQGKAPGPGGGGGGPHFLLDGYRCMAPPREPFVQRSEYAKVRDALLAGETGRGTTVGITTALHGAGGFGKTALAIELCYDEQVREKYPGGILWTTMGEEIDAAGRLARVRDLIRWWADEDPPAFETVSAASAHFRQDLDGKRVLLVVDDVWRPEDVTPFQGLGSRAALLVTTRDSRTLPADSVPVHVDAMEVPEAVRLLGAGLPAGAEAELKTLAALLGEWPLLLKIVNRQVSSWISKGLDLREAIHRAENTLKARGLTYFDPKDAKERSQASALTLEVSLERLSPEEQKRFTELAIFPEDTNVPLAVLEKLWQLDPLDVEELASRLFDLSLLRNFDLRSGTIRLHDVIRAYLLTKGESHLPEWHRRFLDACRPAGGRWPDLPRDESYLWNHLVHHLIGAEQSDVCRALLLDFHYLRSKLGATDVNALLADYLAFAEKDEELRLVRDALRLSAHVLARNPAELPGQLAGRLLGREEKRIQAIFQESNNSAMPWFRPRKTSLTRPGGALTRTIEYPGAPQDLANLPDGRVVSGSFDGTLRVWDVESGLLLKVLGKPSYRVNTVAVLDGRRIVSGSDDGKLKVWDVESEQILNVLEGHSYRVTDVAVLESRWLISGSGDGTLRVWDVESGRTLKVLEGHSAEISAVAVLANRRVISGSLDGTLRVWDVESGQALGVLKGSSSVSAVAVLDARRVVSGTYSGLQVWDVESGQMIQVLQGNSSKINAVAVLDGLRIVSGSDDQTLHLWNVESGEILQVLEGHFSSVCTVLVLDSQRVLSGSFDRTLRWWNVAGQALEVLEGHSSAVSSVAVLDNQWVISGSSDRMLRLWDVETGGTIKIFAKHSSKVNDIAILDRLRVVSGSGDRLVRLWDVESGQILQAFEGYSDNQYERAIDTVAVLDGRRVIASSSGGLRVWDVEAGHGVEFHGRTAYSNIAVLDGRRVIFGSGVAKLSVLDVENGEVIHLDGHSFGVLSVAVLDICRVISGSVDRTLRVWDVKSGKTLKVLEGHSGLVTAVAIVDNRRVISGSDDRTLRVWDVESGEIVCLFTLDVPVTAVAVIRDRRIIVAGDASGRIHFFDFVEP